MLQQKPIRVLIADDHEVLRTGLETTLRKDHRIEVVAAVACFQDVVQTLAAVTVDVIVLDMGGMGSSPIIMADWLRRSYAHIGVVVFSSSVDMVIEVLRAGAKGYVVKGETSDQLLSAIHAVYAGQTFLSPIAEGYRARSTARSAHHHLTPQELHVLKLHAHGLSTKEIADHLAIDQRTVYLHLTHVREKTGCSRTQLVNWYHQVFNVAEPLTATSV